MRAILGCTPSVYVAYRFAAKLRTYQDKLDGCITRVLGSLRTELPELGRDVAIDGSDLATSRTASATSVRTRSESKRGPSKWRCPTGECKPASRWVKADHLHPLIPRETLRWGKLYAGRSAGEREFGRLKNEWVLTPLRVRGLNRVQLHADLTMLAKLACALATARAIRPAA